MNQSARNALTIARSLGGAAFVDHLLKNSGGTSMSAHVVPQVASLRFTPEQARLLDLAFMCGIYEEWARHQRSST